MNFLINFLLLIFFGGVVVYFFMIRPLQRQAKEKRAMLEAMKKGDAIVTIGGLHGIIEEVDLANRVVVIDCEGIYLTFELSAIATVKQSESTKPAVKETTVTE